MSRGLWPKSRRSIHSPRPIHSPEMQLETLERWADFSEATGLSARTIYLYQYWLVRAILQGPRILEEAFDLLDTSEGQIVRYLKKLPGNGSARGMTIRALRSLYHWAEPEGLIERNPCQRIKVPRPKLTPAPTIADDELYRLFLAAWERHPRRAWAILLAAATGARRESLCRLRYDEDFPEGKIIFRVAKGGYSYTVARNEIADAAIHGLLTTPPPARQPKASEWRDYLLGVGPGTLWGWVNQAGIDSWVNAWPHLLRHYFGTETAPLTDQVTWCSLMGQRDAGQYLRYAHPLEHHQREAAIAFARRRSRP